jgi:LytS/YehU family sensor histidine kinase
MLLQNVLENALIIAGFVVARYRREFKEQEERERELRHLNTQMELAALRAQLNPHFLFNALNVVNALVGANPDEARRVLETLSDLLRYTLESDKREMVRLQEELDFVQKYLSIEQSRFGKRLQYRIEADESLLDTLIPPMLLQPLVENAVKHGISPKASGGEVCVIIAREEAGRGVSVEIRDNGVGLQHSTHAHSVHTHSTGIGLTNVNSRLQKLFGEKSLLDVRDSSDGVRVCFYIPFSVG